MDATADQQLHSLGDGLDNMDVMIVEDEAVARRALASLLKSHGYHIVAYASAEDALRAVDSNPPDVALVDVDLPGMNGLDLIRQLENLSPHVMAVLITAAAGDRIENFRRQRDVAYLRKPLDFRHLLRVLARSSDGNLTPPSRSAEEFS
jgi:CheY-like chemotaxis protein